MSTYVDRHIDRYIGRDVDRHIGREVRKLHMIHHCFFQACFVVDRAQFKWKGRSPVELKIEKERFTVVLLYVVSGVKTLNLEILRCRLADYVTEPY